MCHLPVTRQCTFVHRPVSTEGDLGIKSLSNSRIVIVTTDAVALRARLGPEDKKHISAESTS